MAVTVTAMGDDFVDSLNFVNFISTRDGDGVNMICEAWAVDDCVDIDEFGGGGGGGGGGEVMAVILLLWFHK